MSQKTWMFNVPIQGDDHCYGITELIRMGDEAFAVREHDTAYRFYSRAEASMSGKRKLAKFYINVPGILNMTQTERFQTAEALLLQAESSKEACLDLAALYLDKLNRPAAALGCLLQAKHMGEEIHPGVIDRCQNAIRKSDIRAVEAHPGDCYRLAAAMLQCGLNEGKYIEYLLQVAADAGAKYSANAALWLADLFEEENNRTMAARYYRLATMLGNPPLLKR